MKNRLAKHIEQLLSRELCIVVRGLGAFVLEVKAAYWDKAELLAFPPSVSLHFNERLDYQDGFLEERYAEVYGISMRRARIMIDEDVRELRQELIKNKTYTLEGLGTLLLSEEGIISFEPKLSESFGSASYGLRPIAIPNVQSKEVKASPKTNKDDSKYFTLHLSKRAVAWTSAAAILLIALFPLNKSEELSQQTYEAAIAPSTEVMGSLLNKKGVKADIKPEIKQTSELTETTQPDLVTAKPKTGEETIVEPTETIYIEPVAKHYYVIVASERSEDLIRKDYEVFQREFSDFTEVGVLKDKRIYRLSIASFDNAQEAYKLVNELGKKDKSAWVYKAK